MLRVHHSGKAQWMSLVSGLPCLQGPSLLLSYESALLKDIPSASTGFSRLFLLKNNKYF